MTPLVMAIQERLAEECAAWVFADGFDKNLTLLQLVEKACAHAIRRAADLSDLEPKEEATPRTKALKRKWSASEGASNSTCSQESHEIYMLAEDFERQLSALIARLEAKEAECAALRMAASPKVYEQCAKHLGMVWRMEIPYHVPMATQKVCPNCEADAAKDSHE